jgi:hypothetical protein
MVNATLCRRFWLPSVGLCLVFLGGDALAAQDCHYNSIAATAPASRFTDNGNGTVTDKAIGLEWRRCSEGQTWSGDTCTGTAGTFTWQQALQRADTASYAGKDDWRLPNVNELASIVEQACYGPAIDLGVFPETATDYFWSSSPHAYYSYSAWLVYFHDGYVDVGSNYNKGYAAYVRLVRGGQ